MKQGKTIWENREHPWVDTSVMTLSLESALFYTLVINMHIYLKLYAQELSILSTATRQDINHSAMSFRAMQFAWFGCSLWGVFNTWNLIVTRTAFSEPSMEKIFKKKKIFFSATIGLGISLQPLVDQNLKWTDWWAVCHINQHTDMQYSQLWCQWFQWDWERTRSVV